MHDMHSCMHAYMHTYVQTDMDTHIERVSARIYLHMNRETERECVCGCEIVYMPLHLSVISMPKSVSMFPSLHLYDI